MERQLEELRAGRSVEVCMYDKRRNERGRDPIPVACSLAFVTLSFLLFLVILAHFNLSLSVLD